MNMLSYSGKCIYIHTYASYSTKFWPWIWEFVTKIYSSIILYQAHAWFLCFALSMTVCVCLAPRVLITCGMMCDVDPIRLGK